MTPPNGSRWSRLARVEELLAAELRSERASGEDLEARPAAPGVQGAPPAQGPADPDHERGQAPPVRPNPGRDYMALELLERLARRARLVEALVDVCLEAIDAELER